MDFSIITRALPDFLDGTKNTIIYCVSSFALALLLGMVLALMSGSKYTWLRGPARIYIEVIRSTPIPRFILAMALYLVLSLPTSYFARWYERKLRAVL